MSALDGKVLLLTGAAGGQGRLAAQVFAAAGARLVLTDLDGAGAQVAHALGACAIFAQHDIRRREEWDAIVARARQQFGGLEILVNNAAVAGRDEVGTLSPAALHGYFDVNVIGALNGMQAVRESLRERGGGAIVNIASISALHSTPGLAGYGISKWALRGLSRYAAAEFTADRIRVNLVLPGAVSVSMIKDAAAVPGKSDFVERVPLRRVAAPEEVARVALFLASDAASYVTGAELTVDGGFSA